eukprot:gene7383-518_t
MSVVRHALRKTTGLVGLQRVLNPREVLDSIYSETISVLSSFPKESTYKQKMQEITSSRLGTLHKHVAIQACLYAFELGHCCEDITDFEIAIGEGQIEEIIYVAEDELKLAKNLLEIKPWEPLVEHPVEGQWRWP